MERGQDPIAACALIAASGPWLFQTALPFRALDERLERYSANFDGTRFDSLALKMVLYAHLFGDPAGRTEGYLLIFDKKGTKEWR